MAECVNGRLKYRMAQQLYKFYKKGVQHKYGLSQKHVQYMNSETETNKQNTEVHTKATCGGYSWTPPYQSQAAVFPGKLPK